MLFVVFFHALRIPAGLQIGSVLSTGAPEAAFFLKHHGVSHPLSQPHMLADAPCLQSVIVFNVAGTHICTTKDVVLRGTDSWFSRLLEGGFHVETNPDGSIVVDHPISPEHFHLILHYLATGHLPAYEACKQLVDEAMFFGLDQLKAAIVQKFPTLMSPVCIAVAPVPILIRGDSGGRDPVWCGANAALNKRGEGKAGETEKCVFGRKWTSSQHRGAHELRAWALGVHSRIVLPQWLCGLCDSRSCLAPQLLRLPQCQHRRARSPCGCSLGNPTGGGIDMGCQNWTSTHAGAFAGCVAVRRAAVILKWQSFVG